MNQHQTTAAGPPRENGVLKVVTTEDATLPAPKTPQRQFTARRRTTARRPGLREKNGLRWRSERCRAGFRASLVFSSMATCRADERLALRSPVKSPTYPIIEKANEIVCTATFAFKVSLPNPSERIAGPLWDRGLGHGSSRDNGTHTEVGKLANKLLLVA